MLESVVRSALFQQYYFYFLSHLHINVFMKCEEYFRKGGFWLPVASHMFTTRTVPPSTPNNISMQLSKAVVDFHDLLDTIIISKGYSQQKQTILNGAFDQSDQEGVVNDLAMNVISVLESIIAGFNITEILLLTPQIDPTEALSPKILHGCENWMCMRKYFHFVQQFAQMILAALGANDTSFTTMSVPYINQNLSNRSPCTAQLVDLCTRGWLGFTWNYYPLMYMPKGIIYFALHESDGVVQFQEYDGRKVRIREMCAEQGMDSLASTLNIIMAAELELTYGKVITSDTFDELENRHCFRQYYSKEEYRYFGQVCMDMWWHPIRNQQGKVVPLNLIKPILYYHQVYLGEAHLYKQYFVVPRYLEIVFQQHDKQRVNKLEIKRVFSFTIHSSFQRRSIDLHWKFKPIIRFSCRYESQNSEDIDQK